jgi:hypothetical protein
MGWQPGMGRKFHLFRAQDVLETETPAPDVKYWNASGAWLNQGNSSRCTIFSWMHYWEDGPVTHTGTVTDAEMWRLYRLGQDIDGTPHTDVDSGLTSDAAAQAVKREGYIGEYRWAREADELYEWLRRVGPATIGTWWPDGFDTPDVNFFGHYTGSMLGGHQFKVDGVNMRQKFVRCKNSWGRNWAKKGFFYLSFDTIDEMLKDGAEICMARELKNRTLSPVT